MRVSVSAVESHNGSLVFISPMSLWPKGGGKSPTGKESRGSRKSASVGYVNVGIKFLKEKGR